MSRTMRVRLGSGSASGGGRTAQVVVGAVAAVAFATFAVSGTVVAAGAVLDPGRLGQVVPAPGVGGLAPGRPGDAGDVGSRSLAGLDDDAPSLRPGSTGTLVPEAPIERGRDLRGSDLEGPGQPLSPRPVEGASSGPLGLDLVGKLPAAVVAVATPSRPATAGIRPPAPLTPTALTPRPVPADLAAYPDLGWGDEGSWVSVLQARLAELGFRATETDGSFGAGTRSAVLAFQKFEGLERTGGVTAGVWQRLHQPRGWLPPRQSTTAPRVEVDLDRQVLFVLNADRPGQVVILNTSTGGGYYYTNKDGSTDFAYTPEGSYQVYRRYDGLEVAPLGTLYRPLYFVGGWAVHGSPSVPEYPASHGCVRLSNDDADWLWDRAPDDMGVTVRASMDPAVLAQQAWDEWVTALAEAPTMEAV